jgi:hypothetical protein
VATHAGRTGHGRHGFTSPPVSGVAVALRSCRMERRWPPTRAGQVMADMDSRRHLSPGVVVGSAPDGDLAFGLAGPWQGSAAGAPPTGGCYAS